jgi:hypothetical protein
VPYSQYAIRKSSEVEASSLEETDSSLPLGSDMVDGIPSPPPTDADAHRSPDSESKDSEPHVVVHAPRDDPEEEGRDDPPSLTIW